MSINYQSLKNLRHELHQYPEVSGNEIETAKRVHTFLTSCHPNAIQTRIGNTGIIATWDSGRPGPEIAFRSELDALPIQEINDFEYKSVYENVSHKCGHDGHTTILCGLAQYLDANPISNGKVHLLFQPAEENGEGAKAMLADAIFDGINPDYIFALHNLPGYPLHQLVIKENSFTAAVSSIIIHLHGKTAHAAEPEHGINPALAVAEILKESLAIDLNIPSDENMRVITPVFVELGEKAYGISAGDASVHLTLRCWNDENLRILETDIETLSTRIANKHQLKISLSYTQIFHANVNDKTATQIVRISAKNKSMDLFERPYPFKWGEDFGLFTSKFKGCMFGLGSGENSPALHNPDYDFPDELIETGVRIFSGIIETTLANKK